MMSDSNDSGVVLSSEQSESNGTSVSEKATTMPLDDAVASKGDATPTKTTEDPPIPEAQTKNHRSQSIHSEIATDHAEGKEKTLAISDDAEIHDDADVDEGNESEGSDIDEILERYRTKYDDMEERIKLAPKRVKQINQYTRILEERLSLLEDRTTAFDKKLRMIVDGEDKLPPPPPPPDEWGLYLKPELNFLLSKGLKHPVSSPDGKPAPVTHQIDVFVGEPEAQKAEKFRRRKAESKTLEDADMEDRVIQSNPKLERSSKSIEERKLADEMAKIKNKQFPDRIRINGHAIISLFRKFLTGDNGQIDDVVLRPFKPLLQNREEIFSIMSEVVLALTKIIDERANKGAEAAKDPTDAENPKDPAAPNDPKDTKDPKELSDDAKTPKAKAVPLSENERRYRELTSAPDAITAEEWDIVLKQLELFNEVEGCCGRNMKGWPALSEVKKSFECIKDLLDNYLSPGHMDFRERKAKKVRFCDLWHLFHTGDLVVTKRSASLDETETEAQLGMRVLMTSNGRRVIISKLPAPILITSVKLTAKDKVDPINGVNPFCIYTYYLDFNGSRLVPVRRRIVIAPYPGERNIHELDIVPFEYAGDAPDMLTERGKKFIEYVTASTAPYLDCKGLELRTREELNDKVIVDMKGYLSTNPSDMPSFIEPEDLDLSETSDCYEGRDCSYACYSCEHRTAAIVHDQTSDLAAYQEYVDDKPVFNPLSGAPNAGLIEPADFSICHYRVFAYKLRSREWVQINVKDLETPKETEKGRGFEKLVLPGDHKHILESQVREHFRKRGSQATNGNTENDMDLVRGKGQGLIILLHGAPGVGKTCTAECIADLMEKPLYPITCGDLGSSADDVEKNLKKHFTLASRWDCVMLLDEADVFLAKRMLENLQRNSIVSVFLRMLEYYKGLLFLTTNRVGTFDEAFTSRVHISLFYPEFGKETTLKVWRTFIDQTKHVLKINGRTNVTVAEEEIMKFAEKHFDKNENSSWNGRQIRNAFHTAVAMAEFGARSQKAGTGYDDHKDATIKVGKAEFKKIAKTAEEFEEYMEDTMNGTFRAKASKAGLRKDQKAPKEKTKKKKKKQSKPKKKSDSSSESEGEDEVDSDSD